MAAGAARLLAAYAALPEPYQPAWGLDASRSMACRDCDDRLAVILPPLEALPCEGTLRILDLGCAQGYFTLAIAHALAQHGRRFEVVGVDYLEDNVRFCEALAAHHGVPAKFVHAPVDASFVDAAESEGRDVTLALNVLHHVQRQQGNASEVMEAIRAHSRVAFCELAQREEGLEWVGEWHAADDQLLGAYAFRRRLARFPTHLGEVRRPLYVCSDTLAWVGERWFEFDRTVERSHAGVPDAFAGQRRFLFGRTEVVKAYRGEGPYGAFNRAELDAEASALTILADEPDRYPAVLARSDDGDTVWLARNLLPGQLLSKSIETGDRIDRAVLVRGLLDELAHLESRGFHHCDLRCWNVLVNANRVRLIDFGALTGEPSPLHRIALAAVLLEIAEAKLRHDQPFYATLHPLSAYPAAWRALETLGAAAHHDGSGQSGTRLAPAADVMAAAAQEQVDGFRRLQEHLMEAERRLAAAARESVAAAAERAALESARQTAEAHAISLGESLAESQQYAESLRQALDESRAFTDSLQARIVREAADASGKACTMRRPRRRRTRIR
ncbi:MAG: class I SAM-dependent methyltransferase [Pseudomonadota bacterium]